LLNIKKMIQEVSNFQGSLVFTLSSCSTLEEVNSCTLLMLHLTRVNTTEVFY
jgi:hypothetical protein